MFRHAVLLAILGALGVSAAPVAGADGVIAAESVPATPTTTITTTTTKPSATASVSGSPSYVSAAPAVTIVAEMKCTEANLLKCTINEWRDAEVCFVELCLQ